MTVKFESELTAVVFALAGFDAAIAFVWLRFPERFDGVRQ
jgi:hypothetical protein